MRIIIAGSRNFKDSVLMNKVMVAVLSNLKVTDVNIISGTARGADMLGESYAQANGFEVTRFPALWDKYGKSAGYRRNEQMAVHSDALVAFWDSESKGTAHMINLAVKHNLSVYVYNSKTGKLTKK